MMDELIRLAGKISDIEIIHLMTLGLAPYVSTEYSNYFRHNALAVGSNVSEAVASGAADYTPISKYQINKLLKSGRIPFDVALIAVSPPDKKGYVSVGISAGVCRSAAKCARYIVAEVNPNMPYTLGDTLIHVSEIDAFVMSSLPLVEAPEIPVTEEWDRIARNCAKLIEDGATIQLGYNPISFALVKYLKDDHDLGLFTDILSVPAIELIKMDVITNARNSINPFKTITSVCYGTKESYEYISHNPMIEFRLSEYVNDPFVIAQNERMIAINEGAKVDLSGMVRAIKTGPGFGSGFMCGAAHAERGKSIIVLPSTDDDGETSNVVMNIDLGGGIGVSCDRNDVQYVITEYGVADLHGRTIRERAVALIHIAHPKFREDLMKLAKENNYVYQDQILSRGAIYPHHLEHNYKLKNGMEVLVRPSRPEDEKMVQSFSYNLNEESVNYRFHGRPQNMHHSSVQKFVNVDYEENLTLLAIHHGEHEEEVIGMAQYLFYPNINQAEVAFVTADMHQNQGLGSHLLDTLICFGKGKRVEKFFAEVLARNRMMLSVFNNSGFPVTCVLEEGVYDVRIDITVEMLMHLTPLVYVGEPLRGLPEFREGIEPLKGNVIPPLIG